MALGPILIGIAGGALLVTIGLALWDGWRPIPRLTLALWLLRWATTIILLIGALLAWHEGGYQLHQPVPHLILMAALATVPGLHPQSLASSNALQVLPALALTEIGLLWSLQSPAATASTNMTLDYGIRPATALTTILCGGLGAQTLGQILSQIIAWIASTEGQSTPQSDAEESQPPEEETIQVTTKINFTPSATTYILLTLLIGVMTLINLWQRGNLWGETTEGTRLVGAWLIWSAAWLVSQSPHWLQPALITAAALLLISTVV